MGALWELLEPYCIHVRVWVRFAMTFDDDLGPQRRPKSAKKKPRGVLRRDPGKSIEKVCNIGPNLRPWTLPKCVRGLQNRGFSQFRKLCKSGV